MAINYIKEIVNKKYPGLKISICLANGQNFTFGI